MKKNWLSFSKWFTENRNVKIAGSFFVYEYRKLICIAGSGAEASVFCRFMLEYNQSVTFLRVFRLYTGIQICSARAE